MTHLTEDEFVDHLESYFEDEVGDQHVEREVYQPGPRWFVDLVVHRPEVTWYIEAENSASTIRSGIGQALGYAADHPGAEPLVIVPRGHVETPDVTRLRDSQAILIREFDVDSDSFVAL